MRFLLPIMGFSAERLLNKLGKKSTSAFQLMKRIIILLLLLHVLPLLSMNSSCTKQHLHCSISTVRPSRNSQQSKISSRNLKPTNHCNLSYSAQRISSSHSARRSIIDIEASQISWIRTFIHSRNSLTSKTRCTSTSMTHSSHLIISPSVLPQS